MGFRGWHGVTDHLHILLAVSYEPIEGTLACRFSTGEPVIFSNVPEEKYQILLRHKFAGSYFRKHIRAKYAVLGSPPPDYQPTEPLPAKKIRMEEIPTGNPEPQMSLFLLLEQKTKKRMRRT